MIDLRVLRLQKNITQEDIADEVGVSRQAISNWETGQTNPTKTNAEALADVLRVKYNFEGVNWYDFYA